jgi:hypothetical protein
LSLIHPHLVAFSSPSSSHLAHSAFALLAALISTSFFVEPFADAAADLRLPRLAVAATLVLFSVSLAVSIHLLSFSFLPHPPPTVDTLAAQREGIRVVTVSVAATVGIGAIACLIVAYGSTYAIGTHPLADK